MRVIHCNWFSKKNIYCMWAVKVYCNTDWILQCMKNPRDDIIVDSGKLSFKLMPEVCRIPSRAAKFSVNRSQFLLD